MLPLGLRGVVRLITPRSLTCRPRVPLVRRALLRMHNALTSGFAVGLVSKIRVSRPAAEVVGEHQWVLHGLGEQLLRGGTEDLGDKGEAGCLDVGVAEGVGAIGRGCSSGSVVGGVAPVGATSTKDSWAGAPGGHSSAAYRDSRTVTCGGTRSAVAGSFPRARHGGLRYRMAGRAQALRPGSCGGSGVDVAVSRGVPLHSGGWSMSSGWPTGATRLPSSSPAIGSSGRTAPSPGTPEGWEQSKPCSTWSRLVARGHDVHDPRSGQRPAPGAVTRGWSADSHEP